MPNTRGRSRGSHPKPSTSKSIPTGRGGSSIVGRGREIANEWSPRGRRNNSSSRNGRDIPDECSPIGRGSNNSSGNGRGRADDCSPRERGNNNTSRNGKGITDDISPRGRGSTNRDISDDCSPIGRASSSIGGRGNENADEWCPGPNILGDEILDVHEDNEEHVEHVVGSSQNQVGSNVTPSSSLPKLWLVGGVFYDPAVSRHAVKLFKTMFKGAYATWTKVPQDHRDRCFKRFGEDAKSNQICDAWESHMKNRYSDIMRGVRKAAMKEDQKGRKMKLVELHTAVHTKKRTKPGEPGSSEIPKFVDPISK
uniref:Transposase, Ptta/En/Spm n=1 Tax=Tanacetum cinerariifolium TaxID=118510 RepID=A0A699HWG4_TANCI|nr:transposase, Ptta/En/Spm [Tanacetum cinerariifolium]